VALSSGTAPRISNVKMPAKVSEEGLRGAVLGCYSLRLFFNASTYLESVARRIHVAAPRISHMSEE
jgi:hypothetical protein